MGRRSDEGLGQLMYRGRGDVEEGLRGLHARVGVRGYTKVP
jgi:hypothetical protein